MKPGPLLSRFFSRSPLELVNLTLAGTGINVCSQISILTEIGIQRISEINEVHIASGSSYSYLILFAYEKKLLREKNYLNIDQFNRKSHGCHFLYGFFRLAKYWLTKKSFFNNELIDETSSYAFESAFCNLTLADLPENVRFWSYCNNRHEAIELSVRNGFSYMTVAQIFRACISIRFFHGYYHHGDYCFSDINFSPGMKTFKKVARKLQHRNIIVNFSIHKDKGDTLYIKHSKSSYPKVELARDFLFFLFNLKNKSVTQTHIESIKQLQKNDDIKVQ